MLAEWQWDQLRVMKVGGNESATKYFQSHGGSALLKTKDAKQRYDSPVAVKYKDELKRRAVADQKEFPEDVVVTDLLSPTSADGSSTPSGEPADDFFSSWDKPTIKRPSNPPSRSVTPANRTASPFSKIVGIDATQTSPGETSETSTPPASRTTTSSALRKTAAASTSGPRKASVLNAKKTTKLGAKKVNTGEAIDFEEAEKKAKEEAERITKLGYDPNAEDAPTASKSLNGTGSSATPLDRPSIVSPTPISPPRGGITSNKPQHQRTPSELERLGMGMSRLGFGQMGAKVGSTSSSTTTSTTKKSMGGFGSVGPVKATEGEGNFIPISNTNPSRRF